MTETIRCPGCSTLFVLPQERVHAGIRRAKCFKCQTIFEIFEAVERLLAGAAPEAPAPPPLPEIPPPPAMPVEPPPQEIPAPPPPRSEPPPSAAWEAPSAPFAPFAFDAPPSLTLGDLDGAEDEIMEKTLVILPPPAEDGEVAEATATGGFSSAKDAIAKLMGDTPAAPSASERRPMGTRNSMDVEATLSALDNTLSGITGGTPAPPPLPPMPPPPALPDQTTSTTKLSAQEIQAAMAAFGSKLPSPSLRPTPAPPRAEMPPPPRPLPPATQGTDLLKIQVEQETLNNVSLDQVTAWIEQGRVHEYHMVARQFSDHWIEALKVPALRPIFDRVRRDNSGRPMDLPTPPPDIAAPKKSLFGGLFGRN